MTNRIWGSEASLYNFKFISQTDDASNGFAGYHQLYALGTDVDRGDGCFMARVAGCSFRNMVVSDRTLAGVRHARSRLRVRRDGFDHINLQLVLSGSILGGPLGEERLVRAGEVILFDTTRPQRTVVGAARLIAVSLPRGMLERRLLVARGLHGTILPAASCGLLGYFMQGLIAQEPRLAVHAAAAAAGTMAGLLAAALGGSPEDAAQGGGGPGRTGRADQLARLRFDRIIDHVAKGLHDAGLDADGTAAALGLSRSTLNRCLAPAGGFGAVLIALRLDRMRTDLRHAEAGRTVSAIAHQAGFSSLSHATRSFSARFGLPPREWQYRQQMRWQPEAGGPRTLHDLFRGFT